ncbi:MAG: glycosyltransferase family 39 protein [Elusimicrobia bacterium]|nr:glycosyltransferase family 39 protein [Elusimicrobiota bacterium]MBP8004270.1 glycosyltransferase family 39 protein [Elusimicrobiota bacterium]
MNPVAQIKTFALVFVLAGFARAAFLGTAGDPARFALTPDSATYLVPAANIADHGEFSSSPAAPFTAETFRTPGYPFFLSLFFRDGVPRVGAVLWVQVFLGALSAAVLFAAGVRLWGRTAPALWAGLCLAVDFVTVLYGAFVLTETLFLLFLLLAFWALAGSLERPRPLLLTAAGLGLGLAALVRPVGFFLFLAVAPVLAVSWRRRGVPWRRPLLLFLAASFALTGGWMVRNKIRAGVFAFTTIDRALIHVRLALLKVESSGASFDQSLAAIQSEADRAETGAHSNRWALRRLAAQSGAHAALLAKESARFWLGNSFKAAAWVLAADPAYDPARVPAYAKDGFLAQGSRLLRAHPALGAGALLFLTFLGVNYGLVGWGAARGGAAFFRDARVWLLVVPIAYFYLLSIGSVAHARLRIPAMPFVFLLAGEAAARLRAGQRRPHQVVDPL